MKMKKAMDDLEKGKGSTEESLNKISAERAELEHQLLVNKQDMKDASDTIKVSRGESERKWRGGTIFPFFFSFLIIVFIFL